MNIGNLAKTTGCPTETIRFYEKEGLLPVVLRSENNYRRYDQHHVDRIRFIRNCRMLDMSHSEIRMLIELMTEESSQCDQIKQILTEHIDHVEARIAELKQLRQQLANVADHCITEQSTMACGIVDKLTTMETKKQKKSHLG